MVHQGLDRFARKDENQGSDTYAYIYINENT